MTSNCQWCGRRFFWTQASKTRKYCGYPCSIAAGRKPKKPLESRFWSKVRKSDGCWEWTGSKFSTGYGEFKIVGHVGKLAHRISYEMTKGSIPKGICVCHSCDNRSCVNPEHLFLGSHKDNSNDMAAKGRSSKGEKNGESKLSETDVLEIVSCLKLGMLKKDIAAKFRVTTASVYLIRKGINWGWLTGLPLQPQSAAAQS